MKWDGNKYSGVLLLGCNRAQGVWANQVQYVGSPVVRNGGRLNASATNHTLLVFALISGLRSISNKTAAEIVSKRRDGRNKPSLLVKIVDNSFGTALKSAIQGQQGPPLRVIRSLHQPLIRQISRFTLTIETEEHNPAILGMLDWTAHSILLPSDISDVAPVMMPAAVNVREQSVPRR